MSWISKALGLDKNKDLLKQINELLRGAAYEKQRDMEKKFIALCLKKGVTQESAETCFDVLLDLAS